MEKNVHILKEMMSSIQSRLRRNSSTSIVPDVYLAIVGTGPSEKQLKELFKSYQNVVFVGQLTGYAASKCSKR